MIELAIRINGKTLSPQVLERQCSLDDDRCKWNSHDFRVQEITDMPLAALTSGRQSQSRSEAPFKVAHFDRPTVQRCNLLHKVKAEPSALLSGVGPFQ